MPTFGDYQTTGDPLTTTEGSGHSSQVWLARKNDAPDGRLYAIKVYIPRQRRRAQETSETTLEEDRALEFLDGVKQLKKAQSEAGKAGLRLTPIHEFGKTPEGNAAWFVTDFYGEAEPFLPRSLQSYIIRGGRLDGEALRNIIHSVVTGCLVLQKSRGFSHGNLKSTNVFRVGKSRPLRKTPLQLADAFPAAPVQLSSLDPSYRESIGELLQQTMEVQDLRAIGVLILQLVEGRLITTDSDYDYPASSSPAWDRLGKDSARWLEVCNRLLDPSLSLERVNLTALEKEFRPSPVNVPMIAAAVALLCLICVGGFFFFASRKKQITFRDQPRAQTKYVGQTAEFSASASGAQPMTYQWRKNGAVIPGATTSMFDKANLTLADAGSYDVVASNPYRSVTSSVATLTVTTSAPQVASQPANPSNYQIQFEAAQKALDSAANNSPTDLVAALDDVNQALALAPSDAPATQLKNKIVAAIGTALSEVLRKANQAITRTNLDEAMKRRAVATLLKPGDPRVAQLSSNIFNTAFFAATNAVEGMTVNLDEAERHWKFLQELDPANSKTDHVKSLIEAFDSQISDAARADQAAVDGDIKTIADATNLVNAVNGTGIFTWRPSDTNATSKLIQQLEQKRTASLETAYNAAINALKNNNISEARNHLEIFKALDPSDSRIATLEGLVNSASTK